MNYFKLAQESHIAESNITVRLFRHEKCGAELIHIPCEDNNKVFAVRFATLPTDDTGIAHIIEHTVLSGSEKYPVKELFSNLIKGSMNTYLNAMTMPDHTLYAIASQNEKDFMNLLACYTDCVFKPLIYKDCLSFMQEGWNFAFDEDGTPFFNGVVFNEMKGSFASPDMRLMTEANRVLFDGTYACVSGGDPKAIPNLRYEDFLAFHKKHYTAANARFFVYGNADIETVMNFLHNEYLHCAKGEKIAKVPMVKANPSPQYIKSTYPSNEPSNIASMDFVLGDCHDMLQNFASKILVDTLLISDVSPLRQKLIASGFCQDIQAFADDSRPLSIITVEFYGLTESDPKQVEKRFLDELFTLNLTGMQEDFLSALAHMEFKYKEADPGNDPKGFLYAMPLLTQIADGEDPFIHLRFAKPIADLRNIIQNNGLQPLLQTYFNNPHRATVLLCPDATLLEQEAVAESKAALQAWQNLSETARKEEIKRIEALYNQQESPDSEEALATLPKLHLHDVQEGKPYRDASEITCNGQKLLYYEADTKGILYFKLMMPVPKGANLFLLSLVASLLSNMDTTQRTAKELSRNILQHTGGLSFGLDFYKEKTYFGATAKCLPEKLDITLELIADMLCHSQFTDQERIANLLAAYAYRMQNEIYENGTVFGEEEVLATLQTEALHSNQSSGLACYAQLRNVLENENAFADTLQAMPNALDSVLSAKAMVAALVASKPLVEGFAHAIQNLNKALPQEAKALKTIVSLQAPTLPKGVVVPSAVQFISMGDRLFAESQYHGSYRVMEALLNNDYLWQALRVKGGAYGASCNITRNGLLIFSSFHDPNGLESIAAMRQAASFMQNLQLTEEELESTVIGAVAAFDTPLSVEAEGMNAIYRYFMNVPAALLAKERTQVLATTLQDLQNMAKPLQAVCRSNRYCILGNESIFAENPEAFAAVEQV